MDTPQVSITLPLLSAARMALAMCHLEGAASAQGGPSTTVSGCSSTKTLCSGSWQTRRAPPVPPTPAQDLRKPIRQERWSVVQVLPFSQAPTLPTVMFLSVELFMTRTPLSLRMLSRVPTAGSVVSRVCSNAWSWCWLYVPSGFLYFPGFRGGLSFPLLLCGLFYFPGR